jgi:hypothetical protein
VDASETVVSNPGDELDTIVRSGCRLIAESVEHAHCICRCHTATNLIWFQPLDRPGFIGWRGLACYGVAAKYQRHDSSREILVDTGEAFYLHVDTGFLGDFPADARLERLVELENAARRLPMRVVSPLHSQDAPVIADDDACDANGVLRRAAHLQCPSVDSK